MSLANGQEAVRLLFEAGVPILAGTDARNPGTAHGASLHRELVLLTESGLSAAAMLCARLPQSQPISFSLADRGRIAPGLRADLLLVNGDPTLEITATRDIVGVWKLGVRSRPREAIWQTLKHSVQPPLPRWRFLYRAMLPW